MASPPHRSIRIGSPLRLGFVPLVDAAPLIVAREFGLFEAAGLSVELVREPGWATVRDKLVFGREFEGAHALAGLAFSISYGVDCVATHCLTGYVLNRHGNAVTFSSRLWEEGVQSMADLHPRVVGSGGRRLRLGIVHPASSHHFLLHSMLGRAGLVLERDAEIVVLPPELMPVALERGHIDGFCAGEPWNSAAIQSGHGFCIATSSELCFAHPEKVLLVTAEFERRCHEQHMILIEALKVAGRICDDPDHRTEIAKLLSAPRYLNTPREVIFNSLGQTFHRGFDQYTAADTIHSFSGDEVNRPTTDKANLVLGQLRDCGLLRAGASARGPKPEEIFRNDLYDGAVPRPASSKRSTPAAKQPAVSTSPPLKTNNTP